MNEFDQIILKIKSNVNDCERSILFNFVMADLILF